MELTEDNAIIHKRGELSVKLFSRMENGSLYNMICTRVEAKGNALLVKEKININVLCQSTYIYVLYIHLLRYIVIVCVLLTMSIL